MRDIAFALVLLTLLALALRRPWIGLMCWVWVSLMTPQMLTYGFMLGAPVSLMCAIATLLGILFSKDPKSFPLAPSVVLLIVFSLWMVVTYFFSLVPTDENAEQLVKVMKINLFTLVTVLVIHSRRQIDILIAVVALSVAFFGIKGGVFTILTGGDYRVRGAGGFIAGNNEIGLGMILTVPLLYYLILINTRRWLHYALWVAIVLTVVATLGTQSRGALLGILAMTLAFVLRSPKPGRLLLPIAALAVFVVMFMPEAWWERMQTIRTYDEDASSLGRINAWTMAFNVASHNVFGGGFNLETPLIFQRYAPNPDFIAVAHSIYFQVLGQHGFIGLAIYLVFWISVFVNCSWLSRNARSPADVALARMIQVSLIGFAVGGAFLNFAYYDAPYYLMAALVVMRYKLMGNVAASSRNRPATVSHPQRKDVAGTS